MRWFGKSWGAPVCVEGRHVEPPIGIGCAGCDAAIGESDQGVLLPFVGAEADDPKVVRRREVPGGVEGLETCETWLAYHLVCFLESVIPGHKLETG